MTTEKAAATEDKAPKAKTPKRQSEDDLVAKYDGIVEGSLRFVDKAAIEQDVTLAQWKGKQVVTRICERPEQPFTLGTSDLWQCRFHPAVRAEVRRETARERRAALKKLAEGQESTEAVAEVA